MRVFEEAEGEFKLFGRAALGEGVRLQLFDDDQLLTFQIRNAPLIGRDDRGRGGFHDPVEELFNLLLGLAQIIAQGLGDFFGTAATLLPCFEEQVFEQASGLR